jgi:hypothetical protein
MVRLNKKPGNNKRWTCPRCGHSFFIRLERGCPKCKVKLYLLYEFILDEESFVWNPDTREWKFFPDLKYEQSKDQP